MALLLIASLGCNVSGDSIPPAHGTANPHTTLAWTANGKQIVFSREVQGTFVYDISAMQLHTIPLHTPIGNVWEPTSASGALSPDGSRVAYVAVFNDGAIGTPNAEIMTARIDGTDVRRLTYTTHFKDTNPAWSPDGNQIAYISNEDRRNYGTHGCRRYYYLEGHSAQPAPIQATTIRPNGRPTAVGLQYSTIVSVWSRSLIGGKAS